ncbi:MAG: hypothetical protein Q9169_008648, partial [Polycauliona sp. 2 TL-2023]
MLAESPKSLLALRLTSRANKDYVDPVLYRYLELSDEDGKFKSTEHKIQRLLNSEDRLSQHVRHLVVSNTKRAYTNFGILRPTSDDFRPGDLEAVIEKLHRLQSL